MGNWLFGCFGSWVFRDSLVAKSPRLVPSYADFFLPLLSFYQSDSHGSQPISHARTWCRTNCRCRLFLDQSCNGRNSSLIVSSLETFLSCLYRIEVELHLRLQAIPTSYSSIAHQMNPSSQRLFPSRNLPSSIPQINLKKFRYNNVESIHQGPTAV